MRRDPPIKFLSRQTLPLLRGSIWRGQHQTVGFADGRGAILHSGDAEVEEFRCLRDAVAAGQENVLRFHVAANDPEQILDGNHQYTL